MKKNFRIATMAYLIFLGAVLGAVVFGLVAIVPVELEALRWAVYGLMLVVALYEGYKYKMGERDKPTSTATLAVLMSGVLFVGYYLPDTLHAQGEVTSGTIGAMISLGVLALAVGVLMVLNMRKACR
jgi:hypothetical protein